jgi:hypothetical protein
MSWRHWSDKLTPRAYGDRVLALAWYLQAGAFIVDMLVLFVFALASAKRTT